MNYELELYKLCYTDDNEYGICIVDELGWISDNKFCVWVSYLYLKEFMNKLKELFGYGIFDDGGFDANIQADCVCIDLCEAIGNFIDIEEVFPKDKYEH
jgi:hypothetical protein